MKTYTKGERVNTVLGAGAVAGFEHFDDEGMSLPPSDTDTGGRVVVTLDDPSAWIGQEKHGDPYMFRSEITN